MRRAKWLLFGSVLYVLAMGSVAATELGIDRGRFTVDGRATFLLGISFYVALGAPNESILRDLDDMPMCGFNWIRVWATRSAFGNDVSAVDDAGQARALYLEKLKWLVMECDRRKMIVDVTLTRGEGRLGAAHVATMDAHRRAVERSRGTLPAGASTTATTAGGEDAQPRRSFDLRTKRLFDQMDVVERETVNVLAAAIRESRE